MASKDNPPRKDLSGKQRPPVWVLKYLWKIVFVACFSVALASSLWLSFDRPHWAFYLLSELASVGLGITSGWWWVDFDYSKPESLSSPVGDRRQLGFLNLRKSLGFFHSRVAMRSQELFNITIVGPTIRREQVLFARELVRNYWQLAKKKEPAGSEGPTGQSQSTEPSDVK